MLHPSPPRRPLLLIMLIPAALVGCDASPAANPGAPDAGGLDVGPAGVGEDAGAGPEASACSATWEEPTAELVHAATQELQLRILHEEVGRFLDGSTPVFVGSFTARDTRGNWDPAHGDGAVDSRAAAAWLGPVTWPSDGRQLVLVDLQTGRSIALRQLDDAPGRTEGSLVMDCPGSHSFPSHCDGCLPALDPAARQLELGPLTLSGIWWSGGQAADLEVSLSLTRVAAPDVEVAHVLAFDGASCGGPERRPGYGAGYRVEGHELVATRSGSFGRDVDSPDCSVRCQWPEARTPDGVFPLGGCHQEVSWVGEVFIDLDEPTIMGLRELELQPATVCCSYADPCGGAALFSRCFPP